MNNPPKTLRPDVNEPIGFDKNSDIDSGLSIASSNLEPKTPPIMAIIRISPIRSSILFDTNFFIGCDFLFFH